MGPSRTFYTITVVENEDRRQSVRSNEGAENKAALKRAGSVWQCLNISFSQRKEWKQMLGDLN